MKLKMLTKLMMNRRLVGALVGALVAQGRDPDLALPRLRRMCRSVSLLFAWPKLVAAHSWRPLSF